MVARDDEELFLFAPGIHARMRGTSGPTVLWVHGYSLDSRIWRPIWDRMPQWRHVGIDLPGHGASPELAEHSSLGDVGATLAEACVEQGISHLVAMSFGTMTATQMAVARPDQFRRLALAGPALAGGPQDPDVGRAFGQLMLLFMQGANSDSMCSHWLGCKAWRGMDRRDGLAAEIRHIVDSQDWTKLMGPIRHFSTYFSPIQDAELIATIRARTLVLLADRELNAFRDCARIIMSSVPDCTTHNIPDSDHLSILQHPELSAEILNRFLGDGDAGLRMGARS